MTNLNAPESVAVIGMSCRFPGAAGIDEYWQNLRGGVESIRTFSDAELEMSGFPAELFTQPGYVKAQGALADITSFDASFFGFNPREADILDPQQRLFLECAWEALEYAGYQPNAAPGLVGVYGGAALSGYMRQLLDNVSLRESIGPFQLVLANDKDFLTTRVGYKLNLRGPCVTVQSTCSSSLVAITMASQSLRTYQCDMALAGGVHLVVPQASGYLYQEGGILSPDGHCRAFDAAAAGTVAGSGAGVVVLKRLSEALADGDTVYAVIRGAAINNDGAAKVGFTAPSVAGQADVIVNAMAQASVSPDEIGYIEAHGTGTILGDPIEIAALTQAFRVGTDRRGYCPVGSVKTNIGHLDAASGVAGFIKTVLALHHQELPPTLHFTRPNPKLRLDDSPFFINSELRPWPRTAKPRIAGVSSYGIGGTNAHVIIEEAPVVSPTPRLDRPSQLMVLSAATPAALGQAAANLAAHLERHPEQQPADVAYTLQVGRAALPYRASLVCRTPEDAIRTLRNSRQLSQGHAAKRQRPVAFLFPGQGTQHLGMAGELYKYDATFRATVDRCCGLLQPHLGRDLREVIYGPLADAELAAAALQQTALAQPALFVIEYALAQWWGSLGVVPQAMLGHSIGEYVAACLAGVFGLEDALSLVAARGQLMQSLPSGAMLAVPLAELELRPLLGEAVSIAAVNGPALCVASGPVEAIAQLEARLATGGTQCSRLHTSHAFHSAMMDPMLEEFRQEVSRIPLSTPRIPFVSNVSGTWITTEQATSADYWAEHVRQTVRFADGLDALCGLANGVLLEVGPGQGLSRLAMRHPTRQAAQAAIASLPRPTDKQSDFDVALGAVGQLWQVGQAIDFAGLGDTRAQRVAVPTYPFQRTPHWIQEESRTTAPESPPEGTLEEFARSIDPAEWLYAPVWKQTAALPEDRARLSTQATWLIFCDAFGLGERLAVSLESTGQRVCRVSSGSGFSRLAERRYSLDPRQRSEYSQLLDDLRRSGEAPDRVVHLWSLSEEVLRVDHAQPHRTALDLGFYSLLFLAQALGEQPTSAPVEVSAISNYLHVVLGNETVQPEKAALLGPCKVVPLEYPHLSWRSVDVGPELATHQNLAELTERLLNEVASLPTMAPLSEVAYRGAARWTQVFEPIRKDSASASRAIRENGVFLITGGLGGIGLTLAAWLARTANARLALIGRSAFPARSDWLNWLTTHENTDPTSNRIRQIQAIEAIGGEVLIEQADIADPVAVSELIARVRQHFGVLHGVIHAAGISGGGIVQLKSASAAASVLAAKIDGTLALSAALQDSPLDFFALCSSQTAILGAAGQVDYCAANAFLDAFARASAARGDSRVVSIDWDRWDVVGMAARSTEVLGIGAKAEPDALAIQPEQGAQAFGHALESGLPQVIVSTADFNTRTEQWTSGQLNGTVTKRRPLSPTKARTARKPAALRSDPADWLYAPSWRRADLPQLGGVEPFAKQHRWLILGDTVGVGEGIALRLEAAGQHVTRVFQGDGFACVGDDRYTFDPLDRTAYSRLVAELRSRDIAPDRVVHLWSLTAVGITADGDAPDVGFYSLLYLAQALGGQSDGPAEITVGTNCMNVVLGSETIEPSKSMLLGPCATIPQEYAQLTCRVLDLAAQAAQPDLVSTLVDHLFQGLAASRDTPDTVVAHRGAHRWVRMFQPVHLQGSGVPSLLRERGVYLITGGLGGVGLAFAEYLARTVHARLVLVGRSPLPDRAAWADWLATHAATDATATRIKRIQQIEAVGGEVILEQVDVVDRAQVKDLVARTLARFGSLSGVIHCAGIVGPDAALPIQEVQSPGRAERIMDAKIRGTRVLDAALRDVSLDFFSVCSSLSAVLGGVAYAAYASGNAVLDAFAQSGSVRTDRRVLSIDWADWGEAQSTGRGNGHAASPESMTNEQALAIFARALDAGLPQVVVSPRDLVALTEQLVAQPAGPSAATAPVSQQLDMHERPDLGTDLVAPRDDVERRIASIWQDLLGIQEVGVEDNFFDLGGHSLLGLQVTSRVRESFQVECSLERLFSAPTIADLATAVREQTELLSGSDSVLADVLSHVDELSENDIAALMTEADAQEAASPS